MATFDPPSNVEPTPSVITVAHIVYALHAFAIILGIVGAATVIGSFIGSLPSIVAVILNYLKRGDARGTWIGSHYRWQIRTFWFAFWQIRTFWFALLWAIIGWILIFTIIGVVLGVPILIALTLWLIYRIGRGWLRLGDRRPMYTN